MSQDLGSAASDAGSGKVPTPAAASAPARAATRSLGAIAWRVAALALAGGFFFVYSGLSQQLGPWSQAFVNGFVKHTYPTTGQQDTTVVLFREDNIRSLGTHYPVPHAMHAQVLEAIAIHAPRAVFVDFAFIDARPGEDTAALASALCVLKNSRPGGTAVFIASPAVSSGLEQVLPALRQCATLVSPAVAGNHGASGVLTYAAGERRNAGFVPSAAFATAQGLGGVEATDAKVMEIIWGNGVDKLNLKWMGCAQPGLLEAAALLKNPLSLKKNCPYTRTLTVGHVLGWTGDNDVSQALRGRTVFYGAAFDFTGDRIDSPVYAELPGVYLHAMAHDNLVTFGGDYKRAERNAHLLDGAVLLVTAALLVLLPRGRPWSAAFAAKLERLPVGMRRPVAFFGAAPRIVSTRSAYLEQLSWKLAGLAGLAVLLVPALRLGGPEAALWLALLAYFAYRLFISRDAGFALFLLLMIATGLFAYYGLNLGPRNVLAYFAFFEGVRFVQQRLAHAHEVWSRLGPPPAPSRFHSTIDSVLSWYGTDLEADSAAPDPAVQGGQK